MYNNNSKIGCLLWVCAAPKCEFAFRQMKYSFLLSCCHSFHACARANGSKERLENKYNRNSHNHNDDDARCTTKYDGN